LSRFAEKQALLTGERFSTAPQFPLSKQKHPAFCSQEQGQLAYSGWRNVFEVNRDRESLFDLDADPREQANLLDAEPQRTARLRQRLAGWIAFEEDFVRPGSPLLPHRQAGA
jgi:hypothetical protein